MTEPITTRPSYRALLGVPSLGRVLLGMQIARIAQSMVSIVVILLALQRYGSAPLAGGVAFASIAPGMLVSPIAGALLDRHGRVRLIILDYSVAATSLTLIAVLALAQQLPAWLLLAIAAVSSLTGPLSSSGLRSLFPLLVPETLWERVNAVDSNGWVLATLVGAPLGAVAAQLLGFEAALLLIAAGYLVAAAVMVGAPDPRTDVISTGSLLRDAWLGLVYTWNNRTLRALAVSLSTMNLSGGMIEIVVPLIVLRRLGMGQDVVGYMFGLMGAFGVVSAFLSGRLRTQGREKRLIVLPALGFSAAAAILLWPAGLLPVALAMALGGAVNGPMDIAMFTLRQRRTDPAWMGRAFTVSMNLNFSGFPIGAALAGILVGVSIETAIVFGLVANLAGALLAQMLIPGSEEVQE
ncbi:MAG: MFS transporter [Candidatus Limnocylindrales bacterium]